MSPEPSQPPALEIAHVLFMDIVAYSKLPMDRQRSLLAQLQQIVSITPEFVRAKQDGHLISLPTGDGMALVFFGDPEAPVRCALELSRALGRDSEIKLRIGMHTGPVYRVADINANRNVAGGGINIAQRVMDCGDAGHILVSGAVAEVLRQLSSWAGLLHDLGKARVKHGVRVHLLNLYTDELGNPALPQKLRTAQYLRRYRWVLVLSLGATALAGVLIVPRVPRWLGSGTVGRQIRSLAVLPLENLSGDPDQEYFADGMTEALITDLAQIGELRVISRTSVVHYKGTHKTLPEIARELHVDGVVEGSVQRSGSRVRISAQLIQAPTDTHLWAQSYERDLSDVMTLEDDVARAVAEEIRVKLTPQEQARLSRARPVNPNAHEDYLRGRYFWNKRTEQGLRKGLEYFQQAIGKDPNYALAYSGMADSYSLLVNYHILAPREAFPAGEAAAKKALELDDMLAEAHASLAFAKLHYDWDWPAAEKEFKRAIELNPGYATAHQWYAEYLAAMGRYDEALKEINRARELDPLSLVIKTNVGKQLFWAHRYGEAIKELKDTIDLDPDYLWPHVFLAMAYEHSGMYPEAEAESRKITTLIGGHPGIDVAYFYAVSGRRAQAQEVLSYWIQRSSKEHIEPFFISGIYAALGESDRAFAWLDRAYQERNFNMPFLKTLPWFDRLHSDARFQDLLRRMNFPP